VYAYEETPIQGNAGYYMTMVWRLSLEKKVDSIYGILQVDGQQTGIKYQVKAKGDSKSVAVTFYNALEGPNEGYKLGDTLFVLTENDSQVITEWKKMTPRLDEKYSTKCNCFNTE
jgi:hypothetical protein